MKLSIKGLAAASAFLWGGAVLFCSLANLIWPNYAIDFLLILDSIYPGYHVGQGFASIITGTLYAFLDGAVGGSLFALVYNWFSRR